MSLQDLKDKLPAFEDLLNYLIFTKGRKSEFPSQVTNAELQAFLSQKYQGYKVKLETAETFVKQISSKINQLNEIMQARALDPSLEPLFDPEKYADTRFRTSPSTDPNNIRSPFKLSFSPPQTLDGIFLLSPDGLYYDSQKGGLDPVALYLSGLDFPNVGDLYKFGHSPNLGGRGETLSIKDLDTFKNTLFDINNIDESVDMQIHYDSDHFLQQLIGNKNKKIFDLSSSLNAHIDPENGNASLAVIASMKNAINAETGRLDDLVRRRKKQIEVYVRIPFLFGEGTMVPRPDFAGGPPDFTPFAAGGHYGGPGDTVGDQSPPGEQGSGDGLYQSGGNIAADGMVGGQSQVQWSFVPDQGPPKPGEVPVNDFSFLSHYNIQIGEEKQKLLMFESTDVEGIVLPLGARYTKPFGQGADYPYTNLFVPPLGKGAVYYDLSSTEVELVSLNDNIETDNLVSVFNFLEGETSLPGSLGPFDLSNVLNCAAGTQLENAGQMIGVQASDTFADGLGVPYMAGMTRKPVQTDPDENTFVSSIGSITRLHDIPAFRDLGYSMSGFSFESWVHTPHLVGADAKEKGWNHGAAAGAGVGAGGGVQFSRLLLSCENTGIAESLLEVEGDGAVDWEAESVDNLFYTRDEGFTRGMIMGFTCDRRITQDAETFSNTVGDNDPENSCHLFIAPTISKDAHNCGFIKKADGGFHKLSVAITGSMVDLEKDFCLISVTINPIDNIVKLYFDGVEKASATTNEVFGCNAGEPPEIPSLTQKNSFVHNTDTVNGPIELQAGPRRAQFSNWYIGGGYTDANVYEGGFMGNHAGVSSGLRGYMGSAKLYNNAISSTAVLKNYNAQKACFKNIYLSDDNRVLTH